MRRLGVGLMLSLLAQATSLAASERSAPSRMDWSSMSAEQHKALKAGTAIASQEKASQSTGSTPTSASMGKDDAAPIAHVYLDGMRKALEVIKAGNQTSFRVEGSGSLLRHAGRAILKLSKAKTQAELNDQLAPFGLIANTALDTLGLTWSANGKPGVDGLLALNKLQEGGLVQSATPDWQRGLAKK